VPAPQSNQRGIEIRQHHQAQDRGEQRLNRTSVGLKYGLYTLAELDARASIEPAWD
jgi:hypothetical protein